VNPDLISGAEHPRKHHNCIREKKGSIQIFIGKHISVVEVTRYLRKTLVGHCWFLYLLLCWSRGFLMGYSASTLSSQIEPGSDLVSFPTKSL
jgi:hypothetical protein